MEALLSEFTFLSEQALQDKNFDPSAIEGLMKLFEIESYRAWAAMELEQSKEMEEAEHAMQQPQHYLDSAMDEFTRFEEELEMNSFIESADKTTKMGNLMEETPSIAAESYIILKQQ